MKIGALITILAISTSICSLNVKAEISQDTQEYIESLDERFSLEESSSGDGYSITFTVETLGLEPEENIKDFFWYSAQILTEPSIGSDLQNHGMINMYLRYDDYFLGFYIYEFVDSYTFYTGLVNATTSAICSPYEGIFYQAYQNIFGAHDGLTAAQAEIDQYAIDQGVTSCPFPATYQNACYWTFANFDRQCSVSYTDETILLKFIVEDTEESGKYYKQQLDSALTEYTIMKLFDKNALPFKILTLNYFTESGDRLLTGKISLESAQYVPEYSLDDSEFALGFES